MSIRFYLFMRPLIPNFDHRFAPIGLFFYLGHTNVLNYPF